MFTKQAKMPSNSFIRPKHQRRSSEKFTYTINKVMNTAKSGKH